MAASLMFQGTNSDAGKSILTAALCRILLQDGYRVAPFKAQNMSLNSFVTHDGLEMGRAQVVQAQASRIDPDVRMNPVLLKPSSDVGSQVIVRGKPVGNMRVNEYVCYKPKAWEAVKEAYDSLAAENDVIILEGAGSPGEINLKHHDIVNMKMARHAKAPVLLIGDIDRGGVFASLVGHYELMEEWERELLAGYVINCFRGDASLLDPAFDFMIQRTGKSVFGVVPFIKNLGLPEEDSVGFKKGLFQLQRPEAEHVEIVLIDLPHISNFTDFEPFLQEPDVYLKIIKDVKELKKPDAIIIPGSKNVVADLKFLHESGIGAEIVRFADEKSCEIIGICGGYQMLGTRIADPHGLESDGEVLAGLQLLPIKTVLDPDKTLLQKSYTHFSSQLKVRGYEIHHGRSETSCSSVLESEGGKGEGAVSDNGQVWGCYLHGIFDDDLFRRWLCDGLRQKKGVEPLKKVVAPYDLEPAFDRLAKIVRKSLDMDGVYELLGL